MSFIYDLHRLVYDAYIVRQQSEIKIKDDLSLSGTDIEALPENLEIIGNLHIKATKITYIPNTIKVHGNIYSDYGTFGTVEEARKVFSQVFDADEKRPSASPRVHILRYVRG